MRKFQQDQIIELTKTLGAAHAEIKSMFLVKNTKALISLLSDCQQCALQVSEIIDKLEGKDTETAQMFVEYSKRISSICSASDTQDITKDLLDSLEKRLATAGSSVWTELAPNKFEILFLPYKASMFDTFESIWMAAKADPRCETYVVPIPYFDRLPDGSLGEMHYEGSLYPENITVTDWTKYNISKRLPDVIFIHNPYDSGNHVTSVHPNYYSQSLKDFTDMLVYIPYFVVGNFVNPNFCASDGIMNADRVIAQSESVRNSYISTLKFSMRSNDIDEILNLEKKFVALGTPKLDKVINMRREDCSVLDSWRGLIEKPDGTRKKVVLYNSSVNGLLQGNEETLQKLRYVFDCFKERNDVVLLWRPHPLNIAACRAMRPRLYAEYMSIVENYQSHDWGIYDETSDASRAIVMSDAYYGDWSSLIFQCQCVGMPVLIQSAHAREHLAPSVMPLAVSEVGGKLFLSSGTFNAMIVYDMHLKKVESVRAFSDEDATTLHYTSIHLDNYIVFAPFAAKKIAIYDMQEDKLNSYPLPETPGPLCGAMNFFSGLAREGYVYLFGTYYPGIVRLDPHTGQTKLICDLHALFPRIAKDGIDNHFFYSYPCAIGHKLYAVTTINSVEGTREIGLLRLDTKSEKAKIIPLNIFVGDMIYYSGLTVAGNYIWLSFRTNGQLVRYDTKSGQIKIIDLTMSAVDSTFFQNGRLLVIKSYAGDHCCSIGEDGTLEPFDLPYDADVVHTTRGEDGSVLVVCDGNVMMRVTCDGKTVSAKVEQLNLDFDAGSISKREFTGAARWASENNSIDGFCYRESIRNRSLTGFLECLDALEPYNARCAEVYRASVANGDGSAGECIHRYIMSQLHRNGG